MARRRNSVVAYRKAVAKTSGKRERSLGVSRHSAASEWLKLSRPERERFGREVRSEADLAAWIERRRRSMG